MNIPMGDFTNYTSWLNDYSQKKLLAFEVRETAKIDPGKSTLWYRVCKYVCGDREFPEAYGKTKKEAREAAATRVYEELCKTQNTEVFDENSNRAQRSEVAACSSMPDNNYIAWIYEFCRREKYLPNFKLLDVRGPSHDPEIECQVVINEKEYPAGQGKNLKEAKQHAAQRAWSIIHNQSGCTTQSSEDDTSSQTQETFKSEDAGLSSNSSSETPSSNDSIIFKNSSAVNSPMTISPSVRSLGAKPKIKLAPNFFHSPNGLARSKENPAKSSEGQTSIQAIKSRFLEDFDTINPIGNGTYGRVFKARRKLENKYYAVKIVKSKKKAHREVDALALFNNGNIVRYYTAWVEDTAYRPESSESNSLSDSGSGPGTKFLYIQMELCEGDTLRAWIDKRNFSKECYPERRADVARIFRQVLTAVEYIHSEGLIHRDLKPANIMFSSNGRVKVGDFGFVTAAENENENDEGLLERTIDIGSPSYMGPEQVTQYYDRKVDIYALGLIYFELLWKFATMTERGKIWHDVRNRNFPPEFSKKYSFEHKLTEQMLSPSPEDRPDATDLIRELDQYATVLNADKDFKTF